MPAFNKGRRRPTVQQPPIDDKKSSVSMDEKEAKTTGSNQSKDIKTGLSSMLGSTRNPDPESDELVANTAYMKALKNNDFEAFEVHVDWDKLEKCAKDPDTAIEKLHQVILKGVELRDVIVAGVPFQGGLQPAFGRLLVGENGDVNNLLGKAMEILIGVREDQRKSVVSVILVPVIEFGHYYDRWRLEHPGQALDINKAIVNLHIVVKQDYGGKKLGLELKRSPLHMAFTALNLVNAGEHKDEHSWALFPATLIQHLIAHGANLKEKVKSEVWPEKEVTVHSLFFFNHCMGLGPSPAADAVVFNSEYREFIKNCMEAHLKWCHRQDGNVPKNSVTISWAQELSQAVTEHMTKALEADENPNGDFWYRGLAGLLIEAAKAIIEWCEKANGEGMSIKAVEALNHAGEQRSKLDARWKFNFEEYCDHVKWQRYVEQKKQKKLVEEQAEQQKKLVEEQQKKLMEEQQKKLMEEQQKKPVNTRKAITSRFRRGQTSTESVPVTPQPPESSQPGRPPRQEPTGFLQQLLNSAKKSDGTSRNINKPPKHPKIKFGKARYEQPDWDVRY